MSSNPNKNTKPLVVTAALPYANGDIHLGHMVEAVQTDLYVRFQRLQGREVVFAWSDDTHGTPIELAALKQGITPQQLVETIGKRHIADYTDFNISYDIFYTTDSEENKQYASKIFSGLQKDGLVEEKTIKQYYCNSCERFLPDRLIKGTCPQCQAPDQYGDVCESCGSTYDPTELSDARCALCHSTPQLRESTHLFVRLDQKADFLREYLESNQILNEQMHNFVMHWIDEGLRDWCISRDGPYFGFTIPGYPDKYFYVWLDAPIGYVSATAKWCSDTGGDIARFWDEARGGEIVHFIGKDIVYFHALFWPVMLKSSGFKLPQRIFVHGFLSIGGEKMSKSRGTFILARQYLQEVTHPQAVDFLRFFFASKLSDTTADLDLNVEEFVNRVNTVLVNNFGNLHNRTHVFIRRSFDGIIPDVAPEETFYNEAKHTVAAVAKDFQQVRYKQAIEKIQAFTSRGNKYYQDQQPWKLVKTDRDAAAKVMVTCANIVRTIALMLKPIIPGVIATYEREIGQTLSYADDLFSLRGVHLCEAGKLVTPLAESDVSLLKPQLPAEFPAGEDEQAPEVDPIKPVIGINDFAQLDLRVATIIAAEKVKKSKKLLKITLQQQPGITRQVVSGIAQHYQPDALVGKQVVYIANLQPVKLMGIESQGMILAAQSGEKLMLIHPDQSAFDGASVA